MFYKVPIDWDLYRYKSRCVTCKATHATLGKPVRNYKGLRNEQGLMQAGEGEYSAPIPIHTKFCSGKKGVKDCDPNPDFSGTIRPAPMPFRIPQAHT